MADADPNADGRTRPAKAAEVVVARPGIPSWDGTEGDSPAAGLSVQQYTAAVALGRGASPSEAAKAAGCSRDAVHKWLRNIPEFGVVVEREKIDTVAAIRQAGLGSAIRLRQLVDAAVADMGPKFLAAFRRLTPEKLSAMLEGVTTAADLDKFLTAFKRVSDLGDPLKRAQDMEREGAGIRSVDAAAISVSATAQAGAVAGALADGAAAGAGAVAARSELPIARTMRDFVVEDMGVPERQIYPRVLWLLEQMDRRDVRYVLDQCGMASGKSTRAVFMLARQLQRVLAMADPFSRFGIRDASYLGVAVLSGSGRDQAEESVFSDLARDVAASPWFGRWACPREVDGAVVFGDRRVKAACGSSEGKRFQGLGIVGAVIDEVCKLPETQDASGRLSADKLVKPVMDTAISRFAGFWKVHALCWPEHQEDWLHREIRHRIEKEGVAEDLTAAFLASPLTRGTAAEERERLAAVAAEPFGLDRWPVRVVLTRGGTLVIESPVWHVNPNANLDELRKQHDLDLPGFARAHAARPLRANSNPFFRDPEAWERMADPGLRHPLRDDGTFEPWFVGAREHYYFAHVDVGVTGDTCGIAVGHWHEGKVVYDLLHEIVPGPRARMDVNNQVDLAGVRSVFVEMVRRGFAIAKVTGDGVEKFGMMQELARAGIPFEYYSCDRSRDAYDLMRRLWAEGKLRYYAHPGIVPCMRSLVDLVRKIDHVATGKKDLSDAMAAVAYAIVGPGGVMGAG